MSASGRPPTLTVAPPDTVASALCSSSADGSSLGWRKDRFGGSQQALKSGRSAYDRVSSADSPASAVC